MRTSLINRLALAVWLSMLIIASSPIARSQTLSLPSATPSPSAVASARENPFDQFVKAQAQRKPIPTSWKIAAAMVVVAIASVVLWISVRVWRASNLFDRQYRFPAVQSAALRLGGTRSGGLVASTKFRNRAGPAPGVSR
jgi:hypothetical protein